MKKKNTEQFLKPPVLFDGTRFMNGSFPPASLFRLGRFAGGGMRRMLATLPRDCKPCCWFRTVKHNLQQINGKKS